MPSPHTQIMINAANEGIPVGAIARIVALPFQEVSDHLNDAKSVGAIAEVPRADWPPGTRVKVPCIPLPSDEDMHVMLRRSFKLTALEAGFMVVLLKNRQVEKSRLHNVVEQQRANRATRPDKMDATDPKMVDVIICKLRKKLKTVDAEIKIETIWGGGYNIDAAMKPRIIARANGEPYASEEAPGAPITNGTREVEGLRQAS